MANQIMKWLAAGSALKKIISSARGQHISSLGGGGGGGATHCAFHISVQTPRVTIRLFLIYMAEENTCCTHWTGSGHIASFL